ncbi:MAG: HNH endonuclease [Verrucomicrobiaceae bacterium]|nr:HNH endonuclease [Verrucomicrobiaceae bacterium]
MTRERIEYIVAEFQKSYRTGEWHARLGIQQDFKCIYCGQDYLAHYNAYRSAELDHIIPISQGGSEGLENVAVCCRTCNQLKLTYYPQGSTREEQIADARRYVTESRLSYENELAEIREMVRGPSPEL